MIFVFEACDLYVKYASGLLIFIYEMGYFYDYGLW